ncbi:MAG TPA: efflux RND transporter periplasmic adaptor subunit [Steroidobacteraceae bacterium]|nr:efflux RND transporter periplasmic adaptor subunit [Steroidobacteraceae bacterium]
MRTAFLGIFVAAVLSACGSKADGVVQPEATPVRVRPATTGPATPAIQTNGTLATKDEMRLSFKTPGLIRSIYVQAGETVRAGQKLAEIELTEINSQVEQARELAEKAQRDLERGERLYDDQVVSLEQLQDLRTQAALQQAQLRTARFNRGYSVIEAPRDGVVLRKLAEERELVPAGQPVLIVGARDRGYVVRAALSDREIVQLKLGDPAEVRMDAYPGRSLPGTLVEIASAADEKTGLFTIEVHIDTTPVQLASGLVAKLNLYPASSRANLLTYVPIGAVVEGEGDRASVFVVDGEIAKRRAVRVAFIAPDEVALAEGLEPGERVVTDGALYLEDGERISVVRDASKVVGSLEIGTG